MYHHKIFSPCPFHPFLVCSLCLRSREVDENIRLQILFFLIQMPNQMIVEQRKWLNLNREVFECRTYLNWNVTEKVTTAIDTVGLKIGISVITAFWKRQQPIIQVHIQSWLNRAKPQCFCITYWRIKGDRGFKPFQTIISDNMPPNHDAIIRGGSRGDVGDATPQQPFSNMLLMNTVFP